MTLTESEHRALRLIAASHDGCLRGQAHYSGTAGKRARLTAYTSEAERIGYATFPTVERLEEAGLVTIHRRAASRAYGPPGGYRSGTRYYQIVRVTLTDAGRTVLEGHT